MLRYLFIALSILLGIPLLMIVFSPISPVAWNAPDASKSIVSCDPDRANKKIELEVFVNDLPGTPDGLATSEDGSLFAALKNGKIVKINPETGKWKLVAEQKNTRLTGLAVSADGQTIYAADQAENVLLKFNLSKNQVSKGHQIVSKIGGKKILWTNDIMLRENILYFTITSDKRNNRSFRRELFEHRKNASVHSFNTKTGNIRKVTDQLITANGLAFEEHNKSFLVSETASYRITRVSENGSILSTVSDNLPGLPANLTRSDREGIFWIAFASPRVSNLDRLARYPLLRSILIWLPLRPPQTDQYPCALKLDTQKNNVSVKSVLFTGETQIPTIATILENRGVLYVSPYVSPINPNHLDGRIFRSKKSLRAAPGN